MYKPSDTNGLKTIPHSPHTFLAISFFILSIIVNLSIIAILFFYLIEKHLIYKTIYSLSPWGCRSQAPHTCIFKVWGVIFKKSLQTHMYQRFKAPHTLVL